MDLDDEIISSDIISYQDRQITDMEKLLDVHTEREISFYRLRYLEAENRISIIMGITGILFTIIIGIILNYSQLTISTFGDILLIFCLILLLLSFFSSLLGLFPLWAGEFLTINRSNSIIRENSELIQLLDKKKKFNEKEIELIHIRFIGKNQSSQNKYLTYENVLRSKIRLQLLIEKHCQIRSKFMVRSLYLLFLGFICLTLSILLTNIPISD